MASINGVSLARIKTFMGHEGQGLDAEILLNGQAVGHILDDANGGMSDINIVKDKEGSFNMAVYQYRSAMKDSKLYKFIDADSLICTVQQLLDLQKYWKRVKKNKPYLVAAIEFTSGCMAYNAFTTEADARANVAAVKKSLNDMPGLLDKKPSCQFVKIFSKEEDFDIVIGTAAGAAAVKNELEKEIAAREKANEENAQKAKAEKDALKAEFDKHFTLAEKPGFPVQVIIDKRTGKTAEVSYGDVPCIMKALVELGL